MGGKVKDCEFQGFTFNNCTSIKEEATFTCTLNVVKNLSRPRKGRYPSSEFFYSAKEMGSKTK